VANAIDKIFQPLRDLTIRRDPTGCLLIEDIRFERSPFAGQKSLETKLRKMPPENRRGFIFDDLPARTRAWLEKNRISYITESGYAAIHLATQVLLVRPDLRPAASPSLENNQAARTSEARPSRFINPTAFNIFDALIRVPPYELANLSGLTFAKSFGLSQSALSKIMRSAAACDLMALRKATGRLGPSWWLASMLAPRTGRGMTPFYHLAQEYRMHGQDLDRGGVAEWAQQVQTRFPESVLPGPIEVAKSLGAIIDKTASFWVDPKVIAALKREFKLVPIRAGEEPLCTIAVPKGDFRGEAIRSAAPDVGAFPLPSNMLALNIFRTVWDLGFSDSRARDARDVIVKLIINAV
jgi:hypothetical protein